MSKPFPASFLSSVTKILGIHINFKIATSSAENCVTNTYNTYTLFQVLLNSGANPGMMFLVGVSYESTAVFQLFFNDSAGNKKVFDLRTGSNKQHVILVLI